MKMEETVNKYMHTQPSDVALMNWEKLECRVKKYYQLMKEYLYDNFIIDRPFPDIEVKYDNGRKMTKTFGYAKLYQWELKFSYQLVDGRYTYEFVDNIIRHEIGHLLTQRLFGDVEPHGKEFHKLGKIFNYNAEPTSDGDKNIRKDFDKIEDCKYCLECEECGHRYYYYRKCKTTKMYKHYSCHKCNGDLKMIKGER